MRATTTPPRWDNEAAVAAWVIETLGFGETEQRLYEKLLPAVRSALQKPLANPAQVFEVPLAAFAARRRSGKAKGKMGRPKMPEWERRLFTPVHGAAKDFPFIRQVLKEGYPRQSCRDIRDRALSIAAKRRGIETDTLDYYLRRSRKDRRRLAA